MDSKSFCYWLQGYFEISGGGGELNQAQVDMIKRHLALVFKHEIDTPDPTGELQEIHDGAPYKPTTKHQSKSRPTVYRC